MRSEDEIQQEFDRFADRVGVSDIGSDTEEDRARLDEFRKLKEEEDSKSPPLNEKDPWWRTRSRWVNARRWRLILTWTIMIVVLIAAVILQASGCDWTACQ
jgi:hypothetical protein